MSFESSNLDYLDQFEVGGNVFELIEFSLDRRLDNGEDMRGIYGVNVAKVREVVRMPKINPLASKIPGVAGIFELRGVPIPAINLCRILGDKDAEVRPDQQIIVTEFSNKRAGFIVSTTHRIRRVEWSKVMPPTGDSGTFMSGMILVEDKEFLFILDLEKIIAEIEDMSGQGGDTSPYAVAGIDQSMMPNAPFCRVPDDNETMPRKRRSPSRPKGPGILIVDDSPLIIKNVASVLQGQGYNVIQAENGAKALEILNKAAQKQGSYGAIHAVVTDIEMPLMDGLTLTTKIREDLVLQGLPVLLHTSLSGDATMLAGKTVGANGYVVKNDVAQLTEMLKEVLEENSYAIGA